MCFFKRFRSLNAKNLGSVGQRAPKLPAVKVGSLKKKSAAAAIPGKLCAIVFDQDSSLPGSDHFQSLMDGSFAAL